MDIAQKRLVAFLTVCTGACLVAALILLASHRSAGSSRYDASPPVPDSSHPHASP
jgi:hypothetical protein